MQPIKNKSFVVKFTRYFFLLLFIVSPMWTWRCGFSILMSSNFLPILSEGWAGEAWQYAKRCLSSLQNKMCIISPVALSPSFLVILPCLCISVTHVQTNRSGTHTVLQAVHMRGVLQATLRLHTCSLRPLHPQGIGRKLTAVTGGFTCLSIVPFNTKTGWIMYKPSPYRAVNTLRLCYTNQSVNVV